MAEGIKEVVRQSDISQLQIKIAMSFRGGFPLNSGAARESPRTSTSIPGFWWQLKDSSRYVHKYSFMVDLP